MNIYSLTSCQNLIDSYLNAGGDFTELREGVLGLGTILLHGAEGKKSIVINEVYLNANSSGHTIRMYNKLPKKYSKLLTIVK